MLKRIVQISYLALLSVILLGCTVSHKPPTCEQLKRQWLYDNTNLNNEATASPAGKAKLQQLLVDNNCI